MGNKSPEELANNSKGNVEVKNLTKTGHVLSTYLYDSPLIGYLNKGEQPEYIFSSSKAGYEVIDPNGDKREQSDVDGKSYILLTDSRIIYVSGKKEGDEKISLAYEDITSINIQDPYLVIKLQSGKKWKLPLYSDISGERDTANSAVQYVANNVDNIGEIKAQNNENRNPDLAESPEEAQNILKKVNEKSEGDIFDGDNDKSHTRAGLSFKSQICIYPDLSGELSSIGAQDIIKKVDETSDRNIFDKNDSTYIYEYTNIQSVSLSEEKIVIGYNGTEIYYEDIVHSEIVSGKPLDTSQRCTDSYFLRLVVAKYNCPYCSNHIDYINPLQTHIEKHHDERYDITEIREEDRHFSYIYFIGRDNKFSRLGINNYIRIRNKPNVSKGDFGKAIQRIHQKCDNLESDIIILNDWIEQSGELRIEGLQKGNSVTGGTISGNTESEGVSRGVQVGPFTRGKSKSQGSFEGKIDTVSSDNTFSSEINFLQIDKDGIYVESDPIIDISYSDIDRVAKRDNGIFAEIGQQTYSISGYGYNNNASFEKYDLDDIISSIQERIENADKGTESANEETKTESSQTPAKKIQDLKELYDDGIISEDEFETKKEELLDKF